jgi:hypothetical protein
MSCPRYHECTVVIQSVLVTHIPRTRTETGQTFTYQPKRARTMTHSHRGSHTHMPLSHGRLHWPKLEGAQCDEPENASAHGSSIGQD